MRVALVSDAYPPQSVGGIGVYTRSLARGLVAQGHQVTVFARSEDEGDSVEEDQGVRVKRFRKRHMRVVEELMPGWLWSRFLGRQILAEHRESPFDVVEFPNWEGVGAWWGRERAGIRTVVRIHTPFFESLALRGKSPSAGDRFVCGLERKGVCRPSVRVASTQAHAEMVAEHYGFPAEEIAIVPLGIELGPEPERYAREAETVNVLYVSRLETRKGTEILLRGMREALKEMPNLRLTLIGHDRPHAPGGVKFETWTRQSWPESADRLRFRGVVDDVELDQAYQDCDIFCVPSAYESFGLVFVEAMAHGRPVVACRGGGVPEVVSDGETGLLADVGDHQQLAACLVKLGRDATLREQLGRAARADVVKRFSRERMVADTVAIYQRAAGPS